MLPGGVLPRHLIYWVWVAFALYWLISMLGNKKTQRREPLTARLAYLLTLVIGAALIGSRSLPWPDVLGLRLWPRSLLLYWIGLGLLLAGLGFSVWARVHLGRNWSGTVSVKEGHELIRTGPYRYVRHPIYTGVLTALIGTVICAATAHGVLGFLIIAVALVLKLRVEEVFMRETFPGQYEQYCEEVPALVPFTKSRRATS